ncbi:tRNA splicing endonuclease subunit sen2 [Ophidiomyces ophidiicola]|nr:tRNA splicing endonuclease subunit sen2 [Ophidiomyces ophidiicola]KAI1928916.1 tRNA splicing endonuclease subunit sen2 [Ophidiomyces ophidiicola]KAI1956297.1 tRNA splicing endonuclease subunit sen2 [Ophidiomyces ophidiicola]KAI2038126.1 tRNA splicing endonuclease subunit sen2 [Ophidiomyces ophidiicola]KAI2100421.1 tRNA splicing endonuclease subunit sen2 [Ophidiomyces ophidiicola]
MGDSTERLSMNHDAAEPRALRQRRPNFKHIHRFPLPLTAHPLPTLIPHNPLSLISVALSYLTYLISSPPRELHVAYFDSSTSSIHVTDPKAIRALWEMGFFGKGSLSRSEPTWLEREKRRKGLLGISTSEEATGNRRTERRERKLKRARKEKEAIAEQLRTEAAQLTENADPHAHNKPDGKAYENIVAIGSGSASIPDAIPAGAENLKSASSKNVQFSSVVDTRNFQKETAMDSFPGFPDPNSLRIEDEEHLQLSNEEAFFLAYGLGILQIHDNMNSTISVPQLLQLFRRHSYIPVRDERLPLEPDDRFIISYVAYHHFRSLGWIVRSGVKFGVDLLLYNRGPVFSHAEFAVVVLPAYDHPYWRETRERLEVVGRKLSRSWWWLHCVNRVQAQVKKTLILCYVEIPPPSSPLLHEMLEDADVTALLKSYNVREICIKRWVPNRSRD